MKNLSASIFLHPHFIIKYYLYKDIKEMLKSHRFAGKTIDIGCGEKPYKLLFPQKSEYLGIDFKTYSPNKTFGSAKPDFFFTKTYLETFHLPFPNEHFDHAVSFQVLEHHNNPPMLIKEMVRIIKKSGYLLLSVPFMGGLHEKPNDYYRMTKYSLANELKQNNCKVIQIKQQGSIRSTVTMLCLDYLIEVSQKHKLLRVAAFVLSPLVLALSYFCLLTDKLFRSENICLNYLVLAKKL